MLRETMLDLMSALSAVITSLNALSDELAETAAVLDGEAVAEMMRGLGLHHRVDVLTLQAQFAALTCEYAERFGAEV